MMLMSGLGLLAATIPLPSAGATPSPHPAAPPAGGYLYQDEFDGPAGSAPNPGNWTVQNWQDDVWPPVASQYRDDRQNVFVDGNSNLVIRATQRQR